MEFSLERVSLASFRYSFTYVAICRGWQGSKVLQGFPNEPPYPACPVVWPTQLIRNWAGVGVSSRHEEYLPQGGDPPANRKRME